MEKGKNEDGLYDALYDAVKNIQPALVRELIDGDAVDFNKEYGEEGTILSVAIENADVSVLANLLQLEYPIRERNLVLPKERYDLLEGACGASQLTPLMQSVRCGKGDMASLLISCGVDVNATRSGVAAIDFVSDGRIALLLLRADSLLHNLRGERGRQKLEKLMNECEELKEFFKRRDRLHEAIFKGGLDAMIIELVESEESCYFINSKGQSALWQAANVLNTDVWAYLNSKRILCASAHEEGSVKIAKDSYEDRFSRSLLKYFFEVKGTHVMKMVIRSRVFGRKGWSGDGLGGCLREFYELLDEYEETQILLEVLQDEHDFEVLFDFDSPSVRYVCTKSSSDRDWGLTDFRQKRVYVGAKEGNGIERCDVLGTLSHELAHKALWVVFQNGGKPYNKGDLECMEEYQEIVKDVMSRIGTESLDVVIDRVSSYEQGVWEQELIVRIPEMIVKYGGNESDDSGDTANNVFDLLEMQVEPLLNYYRERVMPAFQEYVDNIFSSNKMTVKIMSDYQRLLLESMNESLSVGSKVQDIEKHIHSHNGLKVIIVSNVALCYSHLKMVHGKKGENVLLVDWSQYKQPNSGYLDGLSSGAFDLLVVRWDGTEETPKFCRRTKCRDDCVGNMFGGMCKNVVVVLTEAPKTLKKVNPLEYVWTDLSDSTKSVILRKKVNFLGCMSTVNEVINGAIHGESSLEAFMEDRLTSDDVCFLLQEEDIAVGKATGWNGKEKDGLFNQSCYMQRHLSQRSILFTSSLLSKRNNDLFVAWNTRLSDLQSLGISECWISVWDQLHPNNKASCILIDENDERDINVIFREICDLNSDKVGIHLLNLRGGDYLYVKSHGSVLGILSSVEYKSEEMPITEREFLEQKITSQSSKTSRDAIDGLNPVIIADEPGCGKSFIVNNFVSEFGKKFTSAWMTIVDLNFHAQIKSPVQLDEIASANTMSFDELIDFLFRMVGHGSSSFERTLFKHYCLKESKVIVLFDGFDEICPKYRENVIAFLKALRMKSTIKLCATTRLHERHELERNMNEVAYKLIPFSEPEQIDFLSRYWSARLKKYSGEEKLKKIASIESGMEEWLRENFKDDAYDLRNDDAKSVPSSSEQVSGEGQPKIINFEVYAKKIIRNIDQLVEGFVQFTQTPLHVAMVGFVVFEDDFKIGDRWDLGQLYKRFFEIKLEIFKRDKALASGNVSSEKSFSMARKRINEIMENLSANIFFDPNFCVYDRNEMYDTLSIGLTLEKEETYQFVHRTFSEFFFAKWLFREAHKESVSKFWLEQLFPDKGLFRVRWFLEDIIRSHYLNMESSKNIENSVDSIVSPLCPSALPEKRLLTCLNACLFALIVGGHPSLFQYFANGFGRDMIKLLMEHENLPSGSAPSIEDTVKLILQDRRENPIELPKLDYFGERIYSHPKIRQCETAERYNAFTLTYRWHDFPKKSALKQDKAFNFVRKMLSLIEEHQMLEDFNKILVSHGFRWILPSSGSGESFECYFSEIVKFLTGKNMAIFSSGLKKSFLENSDIWNKIQKNGSNLFGLMCSVADGCLDESGFECMFLVNEDFLKLWFDSVMHDSVDNILIMWAYVVGRLSTIENQLRFFIKFFMDRSDIYYPKYVNVMTSAVMSNDLVKVTLIVELSKGVMGRKEFNEWFLESMVNGRPQLHYNNCTNSRPSVIFKFLREQLISGEMDESEVVKMLLSKDCKGHFYFLEINSSDDAIVSLWLFYLLLTENLKCGAREILLNMKEIYFEFVQLFEDSRYWRTQSDEFLPDIMENFVKIISADQSNLIDELKSVNDFLDDKHSSSYETNHFIAITVLIFKFLELGRNCIGSELLVNALKSDYENFFISWSPNILHQLLKCEAPYVLGHVCAALLQYVNCDDMIDLLFMKNRRGDCAFHVAAKDSNVGKWGKLYDVARILLKESALSEVHSIANRSNQCVQDLFFIEKEFD